jgi:NTE family protein
LTYPTTPEVDGFGEVSFAAIADPEERARFMNLPTSFALSDEDVDALREIAGRLLRQSDEYESVLREFEGSAED